MRVQPILIGDMTVRHEPPYYSPSIPNLIPIYRVFFPDLSGFNKQKQHYVPQLEQIGKPLTKGTLTMQHGTSFQKVPQ